MKAAMGSVCGRHKGGGERKKAAPSDIPRGGGRGGRRDLENVRLMSEGQAYDLREKGRSAGNESFRRRKDPGE